MKLNQVLSVLSASGVLLFSSSAYAASLNNTFYNETNADFTWLLTWDGQLPVSSFWSLTPPGASKWNLTFIVDYQGSLGVTSQHTSKVHPEDSATGSQFTVAGNSINLTPTLSPRVLDLRLGVHPLDPASLGNHFDRVSLAYTRASSGGTVNFQVNGSHLETPEPITTLLGSGLALGFGSFLKQQYSRQQKKLKDKEII